ncbi:helix-turn-helix domain-containing protein [Winogradskyella flava]|uniref:Helix-turn-helix domain-containing protein n=1 Tax=Winogradskyella flava TaxID=1884876 RepID=A0A842INW1_9FLAO|nr:helix-turn-helix domain-containing protein [Winogradskyella flava]MBC2843503.1 helix-turn-helix domain-containing protein [Winogradskyella flava]
MLGKNIAIKVVHTVFFLLSFFSLAQNYEYPYIDEYNKLRLEDIDSAESFCNDLINKGTVQEKTFGLAGKAHVYAYKSDYGAADSLFRESKLKFKENNLNKHIELKANIHYLMALRYIETHEFEIAQNILNSALEFCFEKCSLVTNNKLRSNLGRIFAMSNNHKEALKLSYISLNEIKSVPNFLKDDVLKKEYLRELLNVANRHFIVFISDSVAQKTYLDSVKKYTTLSQKFSNKYNISDYDSYIHTYFGDIAFYKGNYKSAKEYYTRSLNIYREKKHKKKIEQVLFVIAECHYYLNEDKEATTIFLEQIESNVWAEYQLLSFEAQCYYYLFKIYEREGNLNTALAYSEKYSEKIEDFFNDKSASDLSVNDKMHMREREKESQNYIKNYSLQAKKKKAYQYLLLVLIISGFLFSIYFIRLKRAHKRNINNLNSRIEELQQGVLHKDRSVKTSSLTDTESLSLLKKIMDLEKEELYLKPNYTLNLLAKKLNTNSTYLSETVNKNLGMSFSTYTNKLRINNIVSKMQISKHLRNYTIEALAKEAGYKSVNSFNNNFKKLLKITPSQYLKEIRKKEN